MSLQEISALVRALGAYGGIGAIAIGGFVYLFRNVLALTLTREGVLSREQAFQVTTQFMRYAFVIGLAGITAFVLVKIIDGYFIDNTHNASSKASQYKFLEEISDGTPLQKFEEIFSKPIEVKPLEWYDNASESQSENSPIRYQNKAIRRYLFEGKSLGLFALYPEGDDYNLLTLAVFPIPVTDKLGDFPIPFLGSKISDLNFLSCNGEDVDVANGKAFFMVFHYCYFGRSSSYKVFSLLFDYPFRKCKDLDLKDKDAAIKACPQLESAAATMSLVYVNDEIQKYKLATNLIEWISRK